MSDGKKYMSMGTEYTVCSYGSVPQKVYMKRSHGVLNVKTNKPVLNANDYKYPDNIKGYGRCSANTHATKVAAEKNMPKSDNRSCASVLQEQIPMNVDCTCVPILKHAWQDCAEHYTIEGAPVLMEKSFLICERRGRITFDLNIGKIDTKEIMEKERATFDRENKKLKKLKESLEDKLPNKVEGKIKIGNNAELYGDWELNFAKQTERDVNIRKMKLNKENSVSTDCSVEVGIKYDGTKVSVGQKNTFDKLTENKTKGNGGKIERSFKVENNDVGSTEIKYDATDKKITLENKYDAWGKKKLWINWTEKRKNKMKIKRNALVIAFLCISVIISGCSYTSGNVDSVERSRGLDFSNEKKQNDNSIQKRELRWQLVTVSKQSNKKLYIELPFEFYDCRKSDDLPEIKNMEAYIHKEDRSMIAIDYGVIVDPNKQMRFNVDTFSNLVDGAKELEVVKNEKRNLNGREITYIACKGKTEKDNSFCMLEFVGVQVDNEYWMVSYAYYEDDVVMAEIAKRSIESMRIE